MTAAAGYLDPATRNDEPMESGDVPQYLVKCAGAHRFGILQDVAQAIADEGASIAATQKISLGSEYALLLHVFHPDAGPSVERELREQVVSAVGADSDVDVRALDPESVRSYLGSGPLEGHLEIECAQRPGLIMAITELLHAEHCKIPKMETSTSVRNGGVVFHMTGTVHVPPFKNIKELQAKLRGVRAGAAANDGLKVVFDVNRGL